MGGGGKRRRSDRASRANPAGQRSRKRGAEKKVRTRENLKQLKKPSG